MKKILFALTASAVLFASCVRENDFATPQQHNLTAKLVGNPFGEKEEGALLVKLTEKATQDLKNGMLDTENMFEGVENASISAMFNVEGDAVAVKHGLHKWHTVSFDAAISPETVASLLSKNENVEAVEYNSVLTHSHTSETYEYEESPATKSTASNLPFNDIYLKDQWPLINDGTIVEGAVAGADVGVKDAWKLTAGDPRVIVAVLDQGVAITHPDLVDALWVNSAEVNGTDGVDDDGNGYIDDKNGYNFAENKSRPSVGYGSDHGTHVAGTIAATNNNGTGVSSIAGGSGNGDGVRIMSCQTFKKDGQQDCRGFLLRCKEWRKRRSMFIWI